MSILKIKDKDGNWVEIPSLNVSVNRKSVRAAIPTLVEYIEGYDSPYIALDGEPVPIVRMAKGTYDGAGVYGINNPTILAFDFVPQIVWVSEKSTSYAGGCHQICLLNGMTSAMYHMATKIDTISVEWKGNTVEFYNTDATEGASRQFNASGAKYVFYAIG